MVCRQRRCSDQTVLIMRSVVRLVLVRTFVKLHEANQIRCAQAHVSARRKEGSGYRSRGLHTQVTSPQGTLTPLLSHSNGCTRGEGGTHVRMAASRMDPVDSCCSGQSTASRQWFRQLREEWQRHEGSEPDCSPDNQ
jgi:hypothetical protein